ncbi:cyclic pyranopterin monophosphate synthase subunit MoaA [Promicromonospora sp. AC04]|uniref:GTP 3',8-cyclase MoaA n=1 Tax=Promicromonospora sp. AC04 TaxID=2135723 RepID=UPI000D49BFD1|nr:GTP 3',8-cyclase MoaA [Promicromonospora sp. AC04]PUB29757.1 cyclic pyranopterin monophosphate synthase subunit MoaA [Promicromonospora sp. AC04]
MTAVTLGIPSVRGVPRRATTPGGKPRPETPLLVDRYGRVARDLRVSITTACSLRCTYCMPAEGLPLVPRDELMTPDEIGRLVGIGVRDLGIRDIRFTGGEPLMRRDLEQIISAARTAADDGMASLRHDTSASGATSSGATSSGTTPSGTKPGSPASGTTTSGERVRIAITSNALGLDKRVDALVAAGLDRVNISLDTVDREAFATLTRRDRLDDVLKGIRAALAAGLAPVKINAVLLPETLEGAADLLAWAVEHGCNLRFIEEMPLDADGRWTRDDVVSAADLLNRLGERFTLTPAGREDPSAPAEEWLVDDGPATVGIIASVTRSFCGACDRTRLTAEGTVRSCLFGNEETDLKSLLRNGATDDEVGDAWRAAMWAKPRAHGSDAVELAADAFAETQRSMGAIGG